LPPGGRLLRSPGLRVHLLPALLLAAALPARADSVRVAVVALSAPPELTFMGRSVAATVAESAAREPGLEVLTPDAVERSLGRSDREALVRCADDARCLATRARPLGVDRVIGGWIAKAGGAYRVVLVQVDVKTGAPLSRIDRAIPIAARRLQADVAAAAPVLVRGEAELRGVLVVVADVAGADVAIDDAPAGIAPVQRELKPGKHKVQVSKAGYILQDPVWVEVPALAEITHRARLREIPARNRPGGETRVEVMK